tara:strand:- start:325 stop:1239 length:915 start_codon:yes stop_codon:yes gene_type:complete
MITKQTEINQYLQDYHSGKIAKGLDTGLLKLDESIRFKTGQLTIINGLDNVGKTIWILWYFLTLSVKHNLKWCIYSGENKSGQLVRQLIQFYTGKYLNKMELSEVMRIEIIISKYFTFVDNVNFYKSKDLFKIFADGDYDGCLIDPFTGMDREYTHAANYDFLNECRSFCNMTDKSIYVNTHVVSEAARRTYTEGHEYSGYPYPPSKSQSEGGQPFGNRTDDFLTIHRLVGHPIRNFITEIHVRKIKDTETGGSCTSLEMPLDFEFNSGLGFTMDGQNILNESIKDDNELKPLPLSDEYDTTPF